MKRWGHSHSVVSGFVGGLLLMANGWLILAALLLCVLAGWWAHALRKQIGTSLHTAGALMRERVKTERSRRRLNLETARDRRADREKRETAAYWRGARDATP